MKLLNFNVMYTSVFGCINLDRKDKERHFFLTSRKRDVRFVVIQKPLKDSFCVPKLRQHLIGIHTFIANELLIFFPPNIISVGYRMSPKLQYIGRNITIGENHFYHFSSKCFKIYDLSQTGNFIIQTMLNRKSYLYKRKSYIAYTIVSGCNC